MADLSPPAPLNPVVSDDLTEGQSEFFYNAESLISRINRTAANGDGIRAEFPLADALTGPERIQLRDLYGKMLTHASTLPDAVWSKA